MNIGATIRRLRLSGGRKLTRSALARMAGVSDVALLYIERGDNNASVGTLEKIAKALNVAVSDLVREPRKKRA